LIELLGNGDNEDITIYIKRIAYSVEHSIEHSILIMIECKDHLN